mgnify:CR=1 FL=1
MSAYGKYLGMVRKMKEEGKLETKPKEKIYRLTSLDAAIEMLRPSAEWEITNNKFTVWNDPRPQPTMEEIYEVQRKAKEFEDSINMIWLDDKKKEYHQKQNEFQKRVDVEMSAFK